MIEMTGKILVRTTTSSVTSISFSNHSNRVRLQAKSEIGSIKRSEVRSLKSNILLGKLKLGSRNHMDFIFFILLNGLLLVRPEELLPELMGLHLYLVIICLCTVSTLQGIIRQISLPVLLRSPITVCLLGLLVAIACSQIFRNRLDLLEECIPEFAKVLLYFVLMQAVVNTPLRIASLIGWIVIFTIILTTVGLLQYHEFIDVENLRPIVQKEYDQESGEVTSYPRLCSIGIYNDPNDLCLILVTASFGGLCRASLGRSSLSRCLWLCPLGLFGYAMMLTQSRGGLLGLLIGVTALLYARYGWKRCLPLAALCVPALLLLFGGRQTNFNTTGEDTAQERLRLWAEGLSLMSQNPLTGIGVGQYFEELGHVAHNSFVQAYVETGLFGGTLFVGAFYLAIIGTRKIHEIDRLQSEPMLSWLQPFIFAMVAAYAAGAYTVSRNFVLPTYMILGLAAAFISQVHTATPDWLRVDPPMMFRLTFIGVMGLVFLKLFTQSMVQYG